MPNAAVKTPVCDICGVETREGSDFCYNCGGSLKQTVVAAPIPETPAVVPTTNGSAMADGKEQPLGAARRRKNPARGPVEIVWEPRSGISIGYIVGSIILIVIAILLFAVSIFLK